MALIKFNDLPNTNTPINANNLNNNFNEVLGKLEQLNNSEITTKELHTLKANINNYDLIIICTNGNSYNHYIQSNILTKASGLNSYTQHNINYCSTGSVFQDTYFLIYDDKIDTTNLEKIGTNVTGTSYSIPAIYGLKI